MVTITKIVISAVWMNDKSGIGGGWGAQLLFRYIEDGVEKHCCTRLNYPVNPAQSEIEAQAFLRRHRPGFYRE